MSIKTSILLAALNVITAYVGCMVDAIRDPYQSTGVTVLCYATQMEA